MNMPGMEMMGSDGTMPNMMTNGFGDAQLYAMYALLKDENSELVVVGGLNLPTGSIHQKGKSDDVFYPNSNLTYMMQLGTGTLDILPSLSYKFQQNKFAIGGQFNSSIKTTNNSNHYRLGNTATINVWSAYSIYKWLNPSVRIEAASAGKITGADASIYAFNEPAANTMNYGGTTLRGFVGTSLPIQLNENKAMKIGVEYGFQVYQKYNGIQVPVKNLINATINYQF
jgi:Putative MetA-pathway of phenol degradation